MLKEALAGVSSMPDRGCTTGWRRPSMWPRTANKGAHNLPAPYSLMTPVKAGTEPGTICPQSKSQPSSSHSSDSEGDESSEAS